MPERARQWINVTIEEIEETLPNGLHDAEILELVMDYKHARLALEVSVLVGQPIEPHPSCERCRPGVIVFRGVVFYSVEFPQGGSSFQPPGPVGFTYERAPAGEIPAGLAKILPQGIQCYSLFLRDWLSHIHIAAVDVRFSWSDF